MMAGNGQYETKESFYHLEFSCRLVAAKYGKPVISEWTNGDYIRISSLLLHATSVQISPNTLKRIFGKLRTPERYYPQKATRDALVQFIGYDKWESFVQKNPRPADTIAQPFAVTVIDPPEPAKPVKAGDQLIPLNKPGYQKSILALAITVLCLVSIVVLLLWQSGNNPVENLTAESAQLICKNPEGKNPHSAVFSLGLAKGFAGDRNKFTVSFGDGRAQKTVREGVLLTHYYEVPGRYYAILNYDGQPVDTTPVFLKSKGWTATANVERDTVRVYPVAADSLWRQDNLSVSTLALRHAGVDTNRTFFVDFVNSQETGIDGDNFELLCRVNTSAERAGVRCSQLVVVVYGDKAFHKLMILKPGCEAWGALTFSNFYRDGKEDDLSFLAADFSGGGTLGLKIVNKQVQVVLNGKEVYAAGYSYPVGNIYGVKISFAGVGAIHDVSLKDSKTGAIFENSFLR